MPRPRPTSGSFDALIRQPIVQAPMAGGPGTPGLVTAVCAAGGIGFLAAGYKRAGHVADEIAAVRAAVTDPFGVNVFVPRPSMADPAAVARFLATLEVEARTLDADLDPAAWDDDDWSAKVELLLDDPVPILSFTFGCPPPDLVADLRRAGSVVMVTVTSVDEAVEAVARGADALCLQGVEAGGHQGAWTDRAPDPGSTTLALTGAVRPVVGVPLVAAGGLVTGAQVATVLAAGASAAQLGTAFLRCPESGTSAVHRRALEDPSFAGTGLTRAFSGRWARGLVNDFMVDHPDAPAAYPEVNNATRSLRRAATARGDAHRVNLWAGTSHRLARAEPAAAVVADMARACEEAREGPPG